MNTFFFELDELSGKIFNIVLGFIWLAPEFWRYLTLQSWATFKEQILDKSDIFRHFILKRQVHKTKMCFKLINIDWILSEIMILHFMKCLYCY